MLGHKTNPNRFKNINIIQSVFFEDIGEICGIKNTLLINQWVKEEITREIRTYLEMNENGNTLYQNLWEAVKAMLRGKFIAVK